MSWHGTLRLAYRREQGRCVRHDRHDGPLRVLASLYPEGDAVCHDVLVHPPGGLVGGDRLEVEVELGEGAHALVTTPGATRFYRSLGETARQTLVARVGAGARLEWLPLEAIAYPACAAENRMRFEIAAGGEAIGWDLLALGLPAAGQAFDRGSIRTHVELPGRWIESGRIAGDDRRLLESPLGLAGRRAIATLWFAAGSALADARRDALLDAARALPPIDGVDAGSTAPEPGLVVARAVGPRVEPLLAWAAAVRGAWRREAWGLAPITPRVWRT